MNLTLRVRSDIITKPLIFEFSALTGRLTTISHLKKIAFIYVVKKTGRRPKYFITDKSWLAHGQQRVTDNLCLKFNFAYFMLVKRHSLVLV